jgi:hypothetical protein
MARDQMLASFDLGHAAGPVDGLNIGPKDALPASCLNQRLPFGFSQPAILTNRFFDPVLPFLKGRLGRRAGPLPPTYSVPHVSYLGGFMANQSKEDRRECGAHRS